jgi:hypothetical protein
MDGIWTVSIAGALPLSRAVTRLAKSRPTASVLSPQTIASVVGILAINFLFLVGALFYLNDQDWYQCRKWGGTDVSNVLVIGDNYESEVLFLVGGFQYIHAGAAFNFGYEFRQAWCRNYFLAALIIGYTAIHLYALLIPGELSCVWRVNCINENVVMSVTSDETPIQNDFNTTIMPVDFRFGLFGLMVTNFAMVVVYEYFVVNGIRRHFSEKKRRKAKALEAETMGGVKETHLSAFLT